MTAWRLTMQASWIKAEALQTEQGLGLLGNGPRHSEGRKWQQDPFMWWDTNVNDGRFCLCTSVQVKTYWWWFLQTKQKLPDFVHACAGESLWIESYFCPNWVQPKLKCLEDCIPALGRGMRAHCRKGERASFQSGRDKNLPHRSEPENTKCAQGREAIRVYDKMREDGVGPSISTVVAALKGCTILRDLQTGMKIHASVRDDSNIFVVNTLVDMYAKCGSMVDARRVFDRMPHHSVVSWNAIILGYTQSGQGELALQLFAQMQDEGFTPNARTFVAALKSCTSLAAKEEAKQVDGGLVKIVCLEKGLAIHSQVAKSGHDSDIFVGSTLVDMYAKCRSMVDAQHVFEMMPDRDVVSWNAIILGYAQGGEGELALLLFAHMKDEGLTPDARTFVAALNACTSLAANEEGKHVQGALVKIVCLEKGIAIHCQVAKSGHDSDIFVANTLVDMYAKCGSMVDARRVFDRMTHHSVVSWNTIIQGYAQIGEGELALEFFAQMQDEGFTPNARTFVSSLQACTSLAAKEEGNEVEGKLLKILSLKKGMALHSQVAKSGHELDIFVASTLVDMYVKCGSMLDAQRVFDLMPHHGVVSWNGIILGYAQSGEGELALQLFAQMQDEGLAPDARTFVAALNACTSLAANEEAKEVQGGPVKIVSLEKGTAIHSQVTKCGLDSDIFVANSLVDMYAKCGSMVDARRVFDMMPQHDVVSWNAIILGYAQSGEGELALHLFAQMQDEGFTPNARTFVSLLQACTSLAAKEECNEFEGNPVKRVSLEKGIAIHSQVTKGGHDSDIFVANSLVDMYAKCGSMVNAFRVFDMMSHHTVVSWNAIILGYAQSGEDELALQLYLRMQGEDVTPDARTFVAALKACGSLAALETGKEIHADICSTGLQSDVVVANCLVDFYCKCGSMADAQQVFDSIAKRDLVTWSALIAGYSHQGDTKLVFDLFERMQKERLQADGITFLSILTACSHAGLVDKGKEYFQAMCSDYRITAGIEHYTCMVDLLGRANHLDDAVAMVKSMPFEPNLRIWTTVLGACRKWRNVAVGRLAFESILRLDEKNAAAYVLMKNIYAGAGMWEESAKIQAMKRNARAWKKPGQSWWTDNGGRVHTFVAGDTSHPQSEDIQTRLKDVLVKMKEKGYVPDLDSVLHNISDDEKESALCGHSERLAIGCALINTAPGTAIRIAKNLRVCDDCHKATAIISKIEQRDIICRDASRFHVFKDGKCSCGDFW